MYDRIPPGLDWFLLLDFKFFLLFSQVFLVIFRWENSGILQNQLSLLLLLGPSFIAPSSIWLVTNCSTKTRLFLVHLMGLDGGSKFSSLKLLKVKSFVAFKLILSLQLVPCIHQVFGCEKAHRLALAAAKYGFLPLKSPNYSEYEELECKVFGRTFKNPIGLAAGFDKSIFFSSHSFFFYYFQAMKYFYKICLSHCKLF